MSADSSQEHANSYTVDTGGPIKKLVANITGRRYRSAAEKKVDQLEELVLTLQTKVSTHEKVAGQVSDLRVQLRGTVSALGQLQGSVKFLMKNAEEQQEQIDALQKFVLRLAPTVQK